jgi:hypothetical protein
VSHTHTHHDASYWSRPHTEPIVLDIGEDVGALILYTPAALHGREIEISLLDPDSPRTHTAILERQIGNRTLFAGVYPALQAGEYRLWGDDPSQPSQVTIVAGAVAEVVWH